jgi:hypothetical protein
MFEKPIVPDNTPSWRDSRDVCALSDGERHLGHIVLRSGQWRAFDATHLNDARDGFRHLGNFSSIVVAKAAVEQSCAKENGAVLRDQETHSAKDSKVSRMWIS